MRLAASLWETASKRRMTSRPLSVHPRCEVRASLAATRPIIARSTAVARTLHYPMAASPAQIAPTLSLLSRITMARMWDSYVMRRLTALGIVAGLLALLVVNAPLHGQSVKPTVLMITERALAPGQSDAVALDDVRGWDQTVTELQRASRLRRRSLEADRVVRGRAFERFDQMHQGVRVFGADVTRQTNEFGQAVSVFGTIYEAIDVDTAPAVSATRAARILATTGNGVVGPDSEQELVVLPLDGGARLTWTARVFSNVDGHVERIFVDARSGAVVYSYNDTWTQVAATAAGTGVAGDSLTMPVSVSRSLLTGSVQAVDLERPGSNTTYDLKGDPVRTTSLVNGTSSFSESDIASDRDNRNWSPVILSAQTYTGYVYDYYLNNFERQGLDNRNIRIRFIVNPVNPERRSELESQYSTFFNNASYRGNAIVVFGVGPVRNRVAALDIVAHELTHGVTAYSSRLIYQNESGALNESLSDIIGVAVEFDYQSVGSGLARADWLLGEDARLSGSIRDFITPTVNGHPDHYSLKVITSVDKRRRTHQLEHFKPRVLSGDHGRHEPRVRVVGRRRRVLEPQADRKSVLPRVHADPDRRRNIHQRARGVHSGGARPVRHRLGRRTCHHAGMERGGGVLVLPEGLRPSDSPTRSLARRFAGALRSRGSLTAFARWRQ
jgi:Zn-dependent metalloprotease